MEINIRLSYTTNNTRGGDIVQVEIKIDENCKEPKVLVVTAQVTDEIVGLVKRLSDIQPLLIAGYRDDNLEIIEPSIILRAFSLNQKVFIQTEENEYAVRLRLYEIENRLDRTAFVRISHSEIINLKKAVNFDLSLSGTICVRLSNGITTYVSRRYVARIKQVLGI